MTPTVSAGALHLRARYARELMTPDPISIRDTATVPEAVEVLLAKGFRAAPVINAAGHPVGVLSQTDILAHLREAEVRRRGSGICEAGARDSPPIPPAHVSDLMTPAVFSITPEAPATRVVEELLALNVHRLFVVDRDSVLVGVITERDVLRRLEPEPGVGDQRSEIG